MPRVRGPSGRGECDVRALLAAQPGTRQALEATPEVSWAVEDWYWLLLALPLVAATALVVWALETRNRR